MGLSSTGLIESIRNPIVQKPARAIELQCKAKPAPFLLKPFSTLYNPYPRGCSILCNHPTDLQGRNIVKYAKDAWATENKINIPAEDLAAIRATLQHVDHDPTQSTQDIVPEELFRKYTDTDSRPLTPAPTLASAKSRGSRRCLTPDHPPQKTTIVLDLRRSHSQETLYYHGHTTSELSSAFGVSTPFALHGTGDAVPLQRSRTADDFTMLLPENHLPPFASTLTLSSRSPVQNDKTGKGKSQLKALQATKSGRKESAIVQASSSAKAGTSGPEGDGSEEGEMRRRGKRRKKGRQSQGRLASAGFFANNNQDPETQVAGISTDSHNPSSRVSLVPNNVDENQLPPSETKANSDQLCFTDSFLDTNILVQMHRDVDETVIEMEFDNQRRQVLEEALRTRPTKNYGKEMSALLKELKIPSSSLEKWLHIPRIYSRQNAQFSIPIDSKVLETLTPMEYVSNYVSIKSSKKLLYLTVMQKFNPGSFQISTKNLPEGLNLMMGSELSEDQVEEFMNWMEWEAYDDKSSVHSETIGKTSKPTAPQRNSIVRTRSEILFEEFETDNEKENLNEEELQKTISFRTWVGLCGLCERLYGRLPSKTRDPPNGVEAGDFALLEIKISNLSRIDPNLEKILLAIKTR